MENRQRDIGDFEIIEQIGRGAHGFVYKVRHRTQGYCAALKAIDRASCASDKLLKSLSAEIEIHSSLTHEFVVKLFSFFDDKSYFYILMEFCDKGELYNALQKEKKFSLQAVREYGLQLAKGVEFLHSKNVIHRDLKLGNLFLTSAGKLKIGDFGLALRSDKPVYRDPSGPMGTPNYIAPEVLSRNENSKKLDIWAYGVILYTMAVGEHPFDDVSLTLKAVMTKELSIPPFVDISLADLIKKCLNRDVTSRYSIAQVMAHPFLTAQKPRKLLPSALGGKLGLLAAQRTKRTSSQTSQRSGISISSVTASSLDVIREGKSLDKRRDKETSTYQSLLKDLSKHSATGDDKPRLITTTGMQPCSYSTKNGKISVLKDGSVEVDLSAKKKKVVRITADGETIHILNLVDNSKGLYLHKDLPLKYMSVYKYAYEVLNLIKAKIPKVKFENQTGRFFLMMNEPCPNYEAYFSNGLVVKHIVTTDIFKLARGEAEERIVKLGSTDLSELDQATRDQVKTALKYLEFCQKSCE